MADKIRISEIFGPTIQGEGALVGRPTVFVRTGGCDYRCSWCDTMHAVDSKFRANWKPMTADDIFAEVRALSGDTPIMVTLSGGNPAIQPLGPLISLGQAVGYKFTCETQGSKPASWFKYLDTLTLSPKPPSSNMDTDWEAFDNCLATAGKKPEIALKIVIFDESDYAWARDVATRYPELPLYLQPGNEDFEEDGVDIEALNDRLRWLVNKATQDRWFESTILPQLHVSLWGNKRGV